MPHLRAGLVAAGEAVTKGVGDGTAGYHAVRPWPGAALLMWLDQHVRHRGSNIRRPPPSPAPRGQGRENGGVRFPTWFLGSAQVGAPVQGRLPRAVGGAE